MSDQKRRSLEEELMTLNAMAPDRIKELPHAFEVAVMDSLTNMLGEGEAVALSKIIGESALGDPDVVYSKLDLFLRDGAWILKGAIQEEFRVKAHELFTHTFDQFVPNPEVLEIAPTTA